MTAWTVSSSDRSASTHSAVAPAAWTAATVSDASFTSAITTVAAPSRAKSRAADAPMPPAPPVTRTTAPSTVMAGDRRSGRGVGSPAVDFEHSAKSRELGERLGAFMEDKVLPAEPVWVEQMAASGDPHHHAQIVDDLKAEAKARGLWNLFLPHATEWTEGLSNLDYAPLAEISAHSHLGPEAINCAAPDTGNMEVLTAFGTDEQQEHWLRPLLEGEIRSCFAMTEPDVASSDATNIRARIERDGDEYVVNGRKWWVSGAGDPRCRISIFMGKTDPMRRATNNSP